MASPKVVTRNRWPKELCDMPGSMAAADAVKCGAVGQGGPIAAALISVPRFLVLGAQDVMMKIEDPLPS